MANEIVIASRLKLSNGILVFDYNVGSLSLDQSVASGPTPGFVTIGTTEEPFTFGELATLGFVIMRNLDPTNYVEWGFSTGVYGGKMKPNEPAGPFRLKPGSTLYLKANTAACKILLYAIND